MLCLRERELSVGLLKRPFLCPAGAAFISAPFGPELTAEGGRSPGYRGRSRSALKGRDRASLALTGLPCLPDPFPGLRPGLANSSLSGSASPFFNSPTGTPLPVPLFAPTARVDILNAGSPRPPSPPPARNRNRTPAYTRDTERFNPTVGPTFLSARWQAGMPAPPNWCQSR